MTTIEDVLKEFGRRSDPDNYIKTPGDFGELEGEDMLYELDEDRIKDFICTSITTLLNEIAEVVEGQKSANAEVSDYYFGYNSALTHAAGIIREAIKK